jgi:hypothetical protein
LDRLLHRPFEARRDVLRNWRLYSFAILIVAALAACHVLLIVRLDNTNLATSNGLFKSLDVRAWELRTGQPLDDAGILYAPVYGALARAIPDEAVSYGVVPSAPTFRKIALLNAVFGALSTGAVFVLAFRLLSSMCLALVAAIAHAGTGFIVLNSLNSEDVIPAYAFFTLAAAAFVRYAGTRRWSMLTVAGLLVAMVALLHWTLMPPAVAAMETVLLALAARKRAPLASVLIFPLCVLAGIGLFVAAAHVNFSGTPISFLRILYPAKAQPSGWLGFGVNKAIYAVMGMGNYFAGAQNVVDYHYALNNSQWLRYMSVSWVYLAVAIGACVLALRRSGTAYEVRVLAGFGLALFLFGELEHLYSQPQDPQSQIQPMFVTVAGLIVLLRLLRDKFSRIPLRLASLVLGAAFALNGALNLATFLPGTGADSRAVSAVRELAGQMRSGRAIIVSGGFEGWQAWLLVEVHGGDQVEYMGRVIHLFSIFVNRPGITGAQAGEVLRKRIEKARSAGLTVLAADLWTKPKADFVHSMTTLVDTERAVAFDDTLRGAFRTGRSFNTPVGRMVELLPLYDKCRRTTVCLPLETTALGGLSGLLEAAGRPARRSPMIPSQAGAGEIQGMLYSRA